jgi:hypothetical protein
MQIGASLTMRCDANWWSNDANVRRHDANKILQNTE